jgi:hypothetical protein
MSYRETEKQRSKERNEARTMKHADAYEYFHNQAREAQDDSNRIYGFRLRAKVGR